MTQNTAVLVATTSTEGVGVTVNRALWVECGFATLCEMRGHHAHVNTVGRWLECEDCGDLAVEDYG